MARKVTTPPRLAGETGETWTFGLPIGLAATTGRRLTSHPLIVVMIPIIDISPLLRPAYSCARLELRRKHGLRREALKGLSDVQNPQNQGAQ